MRAIYILQLFFLLALSYHTRAQTFVHPGMLHTEADFTRMRTKVTANAQPWKSGWDKLLANGRSQLSWTPRPVDTVRRGGTGQNYSVLMNDIAAAYQTALRWKITGDVAYANKSIEIMNAWSSTLKFVTGNADRFLAAGIYGYEFANAAEIMRTYSGWASADFTRFKNMMLNIFYPLSDQFLVQHNDACITNYWANWDLCNMANILAIGILCDDRAKYNSAIDYFKHGAGNGSIMKAVWYMHSATLGQWQESGRDQGHSTLGIGLMGAFCEMAWNQGDDMYSYGSRRFMAGAEYVASYNIGNTVPFQTYTWGSGQNCAQQTQTVISDASRGNLRPVWEMVYNHYANRLGLSVPNIAQYATMHRPEGGGGDYGTTSGGYDQLGFGTLTFTRDPYVANPVANGTYKIIARHSGKVLDVLNNGTANGSNVQQWSSNSCTCQQWTMSHLGNGQYSIIGVSSGKALDVAGVSTADGANIQIWTYNGGNNQRFTLTPVGDGYFRITPVHSGKCVDVSGISTADGANVHQWTFNGTANQQWRFAAPGSARIATPDVQTVQATVNDAFVYPNPVSDRLIVQLKGFENGATITLSDEIGRLVYSKFVTAAQYTVDLSKISKGIYFIRVGNGTKSIVQKVIKK